LHILTGQNRGIEAAEEAVDLQQSPGDIVILTAADTEIAALAAARRSLPDHFPSVRLANWMALSHPFSVDLYIEKVLSGARLIVLRLLGGVSYWRYGVEEVLRIARGKGLPVAILSGDGNWDRDLADEGTLPANQAETLFRYFAEGGTGNLKCALQYCAHLIDSGPRPPKADLLPTAGQYVWAGEDNLPDDAPSVGIVFYRALVQSGQTDPVDALCRALVERGLRPLLVFVSSLKARADADYLADLFTTAEPALVLNATAFALSKAGLAFSGTVLDGRRRPVLQITFAGIGEEQWSESDRGLSPKDLTMNVVLPELDGRIITRAVSFKEDGAWDELTECRPVRFKPKIDRIDFVADLAAAWTRLSLKSNGDKAVAIILSNYPNRDGRIANGVGLDAPASAAALYRAMGEAGYAIGDVPETSADLMSKILAGPTNSGQGDRHSGAFLSLQTYLDAFRSLPDKVVREVEKRWGPPEKDPFFVNGRFELPVQLFGNLAIGVQPARGYNIDPKTTYHDPDLAPPHGYFAFYIWLRERFGADVIVHMGKHGNLEWLPGKALALSSSCYPEAVLGAVPVIYPFIVNDPGEGAQAKRRSSAVIVDHLMPALARAESHGAAVELEKMIDEFAGAQMTDPPRAKVLARDVLDLACLHGFDRDLGLDVKADQETALASLDEHLCDLKEMQIRDGLHTLGQSPRSDLRTETLVSLVRVPRGNADGETSILRALVMDLGFDGFDPLDCTMADDWAYGRPGCLEKISADVWRTNGDTVERLELLAEQLVSGAAEPEAAWNETKAVLELVEREIAPALDFSGEAELRAVLDALGGRFVAPGPSGAPSRGRADCLPTGRNFFSVDVRAVPTPTAWDLGWRSANLLVERYFQDEGEWPKAMALTVWGTSNMRTGGDDIAQALALIGARPVWEPVSGRVTGVEVISLSELKRPRVDVTLRISGFFRDAFPAQIALFHEAVQAIADCDEPADANPVAARIGDDMKQLAASGMTEEEARKAASFRIFGSKPGAYGAGLQALIDEGIWSERSDLAAAFLEWSAYAYGGGAEGKGARELLERRLRITDAVVQNQDNREHDILDSDDYYQFEGGLSSAVETLKGEAPHIYHNDHSRPERPVIRALDEEMARVVRGRAANPKWIAGVMRHGYKGAFEMAATVDYLFAFAASTNAVQSHHFDQLYDAYLADEAVKGFIAEHNGPALREMAERFREAIDRGLWAPRRNSTYEELTGLSGGAER
jgi:cobaltochelatase CobN